MKSEWLPSRRLRRFRIHDAAISGLSTGIAETVAREAHDEWREVDSPEDLRNRPE